MANSPSVQSRCDWPALLMPLQSPAKRHLIGVSGGRDSVALLHALHGLGYRKLVVCHVNHTLRGRASGQDAAFVKRLAQRLGYELECLKADVAGLAREQRLSIETVARQVRLDFFAAMARKHRCPRVFLAHHAEDQAETVLMRVLRGTGIGGLGGMSVESVMEVGKTRLELLRPLLHVRRAAIDAYIAERGLKYREDATNSDTKPARNLVRNDMLPRLNETLGRDVAPMLLRLAGIAAREDDLLAKLTLEMTAVLMQADGSLALTPTLTKAHSALQHRVLHHWLKQQQVSNLTNEVIEDAVRLITQREPARINLPEGRQLRRKAGRLSLAWQTKSPKIC